MINENLAEKYKDVMADKAVTNMSIWHTKLYNDNYKEDEIVYRTRLLDSSAIMLDRMNSILKNISI